MRPLMEPGGMSFRMVRMTAPVGNVTVLAPDEPWNGAANSDEARAAPEKKPIPAPTPSRPMTCRRFHRTDSESFIAVPCQDTRESLKRPEAYPGGLARNGASP